MHILSPPALQPVGLAYIAHRRGATLAATRRALDWLITHNGMPGPLPVAPGRTAKSSLARWDKRAIDAWFDQMIPAHLQGGVVALASDAWGAILDARAAQLGGAEIVEALHL